MADDTDAATFDGIVSEGATRRRVAVHPPEAHAAHQNLFNALERALPIRIEASDQDPITPDAALVFSAVADGPLALTVGVDRVMTMRFFGEGAASKPGGAVRFADSAALDPRLRRRVLVEREAGLVPFVARDDETVLAATSSGAIWTRSRVPSPTVYRVSTPLAELCDGESLRDHLIAGRFVALLPLVSFLRELTSDLDWSAPPLRASFIFDDPNLHWPSYGHVDYPRIVRSAGAHGYHVAMAMVPLDGWFSHPSAVAAFARYPRRLSLAVHGNAHAKRELEGPYTSVAASRLVAQALRRAIRVERRTGLHIDRVMVPPHGAYSEATVRATQSAGFEAACLDRPFPWSARWGDSPFRHPPPWRPLTGYGSSDMVEGLPMLLRQTFQADPDDIVLRAYLNQPLLLYGHHEDVAQGLDLLEGWASQINGLGNVTWMSLEGIGRSNYEYRRDGVVLWIRARARRFTIEVPDGVSALKVNLPWWSSALAAPAVLAKWHAHETMSVAVQDRLACLPVATTRSSERSTGPMTVDVFVPPADPLNIWRVPAPPVNPWTLVRRLGAEARDRARPLAGRPFT